MSYFDASFYVLALILFWNLDYYDCVETIVDQFAVNLKYVAQQPWLKQMKSENNNQNPICALPFELKRSICAQLFIDFGKRREYFFDYHFDAKNLYYEDTGTYVDYRFDELNCVPMTATLMLVTAQNDVNPTFTEDVIPCPLLELNDEKIYVKSKKVLFIFQGGEDLIFGIQRQEQTYVYASYTTKIDIQNLIAKSKKDKKDKDKKKDKKKKKKETDEDEEKGEKDKKEKKKKEKDEDEGEGKKDKKEKKKENDEDEEKDAKSEKKEAQKQKENDEDEEKGEKSEKDEAKKQKLVLLFENLFKGVDIEQLATEVEPEEELTVSHLATEKKKDEES